MMGHHGRFSRVRVTEHARARWEQYGGQGTLTPSRVRRRLLGKLRGGARYLAGAVFVEIDSGLVAVCVPERWGGWSVVTVLDKRTTEADRDAG